MVVTRAYDEGNPSEYPTRLIVFEFLCPSEDSQVDINHMVDNLREYGSANIVKDVRIRDKYDDACSILNIRSVGDY